MASWMTSIIKPHLNLQHNASILDIGCGFGFSLMALKNLGYTNLTGIEISKEQSDIAKKNGFNVILTSDTIKWLTESSSSFDFIILFDVLEHLPVENQIDFLRGIFNALKPNGKLLLTVPNANAVLNGRWRYNDYTHYSSFTEHSLYFVLKNAQFENIWIDSTKGIGKFPKRVWNKKNWPNIRKWLVRWCWLQVYKAELPWEKIDDISFELNLTATGIKK
jgi:2-polyprenyl-3-methyl-5-hydroxy-6-metoxy-1,4-benzoquinol methylase